MTNEYLAISQYLLKLASPKLTIIQRDFCLNIINQLFKQLEAGHSCLNLACITEVSLEEVILSLISSELAVVVEAADKLPFKPLSIFNIGTDEYLLYLTRYIYYEQATVKQMVALTNRYDSKQRNVEDQCYNSYYQHLYNQLCGKDFPNQEQLVSIDNCCRHQFSIITGGPGTGKTTTVTLILWLLTAFYTQSKLKISICAPTGKAASRVNESIYNSLNSMELIDLTILNDYFKGNNGFEPIQFTTIHKLLGYIPDSIYFRHNATNPLDVDILIIDESSMISLPLFYKLFIAIDPKRTQHIILLGDKNQLSSVEEGYVFASIVEQVNRFNINTLNVSKRNSGIVAELANLILTGQDEMFINYLTKNNAANSLTLNQLVNDLFKPGVTSSLMPYVNYSVEQMELSNQASVQLKLFDDYHANKFFTHYQNLAVLCLVNQGKFGVENLNKQIETKVKLYLQTSDVWYIGRPIMILVNDYALDLHNGDIGICQYHDGRLVVGFEDGKVFIPEVLPHYQVAYALSIHKSQGSEYTNVIVVLNELVDAGSSLYNRELLYTAVTRARSTIRIYAKAKTVQQAIRKSLTRISGINYILNSIPT